MTKLRGPLMSISATGSIGRTITYRATRWGARAQHHSVPRAAPSTAQLAERQRRRDAGATWRALDAPTRAKWGALAAANLRNPWIVFAGEYVLQQCSPPDTPLIPATPIS